MLAGCSEGEDDIDVAVDPVLACEEFRQANCERDARCGVQTTSTCQARYRDRDGSCEEFIGGLECGPVIGPDLIECAERERDDTCESRFIICTLVCTDLTP